jgi:hypothetical protein
MEHNLNLSAEDEGICCLSTQDIQAALLKKIVFIEIYADEIDLDSLNIDDQTEIIYYNPGENCKIEFGDNVHENFIGSIACAIERIPINAPPANDYTVPHDVTAHNIIRRNAWDTLSTEQQSAASATWNEK